MLGELTSGQIENVLYSTVIGRLGCHADDVTYVVPITYAYDGKYIYGHSTEGMKIDMMRKNPKICLEVDIRENMSNWRSVIAWGNFEELATPYEREAGMEIIMDRITPIMTGSTTVQNSMVDAQEKYVEAMRGVVYRVELTKKTGRFEKR
ncbi:pyridoxamine 5'-phosphate oxidase family protein [Maribacter sp. CXY002]|uniref:pyridoxamine 5'-phosphate oxidase family protein n=1 Tax=Maribacter luteocoastalis TaxID=3407671 RepID=UPI003B6821DD